MLLLLIPLHNITITLLYSVFHHILEEHICFLSAMKQGMRIQLMTLCLVSFL